MRHGKHLQTKRTPQTTEVIGKKQVKNDEGGYVFAITPEQQFMRFLILGSEGGTYYASEQKVTVENAKNAIEFIKTNGKRAVELIVNVSENGRAPKNGPAIFSLALACTYGDADTKQSTYAAIIKVCRIGTHLFQFCQDVQDLRKWSRGLRTGVAKFYLQDAAKTAIQLIKYRQRDGWTHRDVIRLSHPKTSSMHPNSLPLLMRYAVEQKLTDEEISNLPQIVKAYIECATASTARICQLIKEHNLSWEMLPTEKLTEADVWKALLPKMPLTAMIRNLGRMTANGVLKEAEFKKIAKEKLINQEQLTKARIHPLSLLIALKTYSNGHGDKGKLTWVPEPMIVDALDEAMQLSFGTITPTGKRFLLGVDVSGSMEGSHVSGTNISAREGAACMALATAKVEDDYHIMAFSGEFIPLPITKKSTFNDTLRITSGLPFNTTDCALPILYALRHGLKIDCFCVYTDSETYFGNVHPFQALQAYRKETGIQAKLVVCAMTANGFTIADPEDAGMLDVVGFDTATPQIISEFAQL